MRKRELIGEKFGKLVVTGRIGADKFHHMVWQCVCSCGNPVTTTTQQLMKGSTKSCGCLRKENARLMGVANTKHGEAWAHKTSEYMIWQGMIQRCHNSNSKHFNGWGGRGISVCERWRNSFENFLLDIGRKPTAKHTVERVNNDGNYEPGNVRWSTYKEQANNRRNNRFLEVNGERHTVSEWASKTGKSSAAILERIKRGWTVEEAVLTPVKG